MLYCKWLIVTSSLQFFCIRTQFILYSYNIYIRIQIKDHIYTKNMSTCIFITISCHIKFFVDRYISILPLTTRKIENNMVLFTMSTWHFLIIWESKDPWFTSSLRPYDLYLVSSRNFLNNYKLYPRLFLLLILTNICYAKQILYCQVFELQASKYITHLFTFYQSLSCILTT